MNNELCAQSQKSQVYVDAICSYPTVSAASVSSDVQPAELGSPFSEKGSESISNADQMNPVELYTVGEVSNSDEVHLMEVDTAFLWVSASIKNAGTSLLARRFRHESNKLIETVSNLD